MNDVAIASGEKQGISLGSGNTTIQFGTTMRNGNIPPWWVSHIENGERTQVTIDATVTDPLVGDRSFTAEQNRTIGTDILGQFNSTETRPVNASKPFVSDPVLYINETRGSWDRDAVTESESPMDIDFYLIVEGAGERFRVDLEAIETDIFGNKARYPTGEDAAVSGDPTADGGDGSPGSGESEATGSPSDATPTDDGGLLGSLRLLNRRVLGLLV